MALLDDLGTLLQNASVGIINTDIFLGSRPEVPDDCLTLYETSGLAPIEGYGPNPFDFLIERPAVQVVARSNDYQAARARADTAYKAMHGFHGPLNGLNYLGISTAQPPFKMGVDPNNRFLVGFNVHILKAPPP